MAFPRSATRAAKVRIAVTVYAVGRRVYVACAGGQSARATLTDDTGKRFLATLADSTEITILGWRPGWSGAAQYRVRATESGLEGWLPVGNLRGTEVPVVPAPIVTPPPPAVPSAPRPHRQLGDSMRPFGQRSS